MFSKFSETSSVDVFLAAEFEEVVVSAQALDSTIRFGNGTVFGEGVIDGMPSADRGIQDIAALDPRVAVASAEDFFSLSVMGSNPRTNDITIDGVSVNDGFGLNDSGQPTLRNSFSIETVKQISVDIHRLMYQEVVLFLVVLTLLQNQVLMNSKATSMYLVETKEWLEQTHLETMQMFLMKTLLVSV